MCLLSSQNKRKWVGFSLVLALRIGWGRQPGETGLGWDCEGFAKGWFLFSAVVVNAPWQEWVHLLHPPLFPQPPFPEIPPTPILARSGGLGNFHLPHTASGDLADSFSLLLVSVLLWQEMVRSQVVKTSLRLLCCPRDPPCQSVSVFQLSKRTQTWKLEVSSPAGVGAFPPGSWLPSVSWSAVLSPNRRVLLSFFRIVTCAFSFLTPS